MYQITLFSLLLLQLFLGNVSGKVLLLTEDFSAPEVGEAFPVGKDAITGGNGNKVFSKPVRNISEKEKLSFAVGNGFFRKLWISSPSATTASDGLGPLYNARSCASCHVKNGRGHMPAPDDNAVSIFLRLSIPPQNAKQQEALKSHRAKFIPEPVYGQQLQNFAVRGVSAEGQLRIAYKDKEVLFSDGESAVLREPVYQTSKLQYGPMHADVMVSPRVAPPMIGLGFLAAINDNDIVSLSDESDRDGDGISGKTNRVWSKEHGMLKIGRFGYKAGTATLNEQNQDAFSGDIGISTPLNPDGWGECTTSQKSCLLAPHGGETKYNGLEASKQVIDAVTLFTHYLSVPARRDVDNPKILAGKKYFYKSGCAACHHPSFITGNLVDFPELSQKRIWPYSDLLLHDMGNGLADHRPEGKANGREWRTPPLWGIGYTKQVNKRAGYLHDGRARNLQEAILWHGGEAANSRQNYMNLKKHQRMQILEFLSSL